MPRHSRVYQIAKDHRISSEVLMGILPRLDIEVKRHTDKIEDENLDRVEAWFAKYPDGMAPEGAEAEIVVAVAEPPEVETEEDASVEEAAKVEAEPVEPAEPAPMMPPPDASTQVFMPPVETTPPPPPPPKPAAKAPEPKKEEAKPERGDGLARSPRKTGEKPADRTARTDKTPPRGRDEKPPSGKRDQGRPAQPEPAANAGRQIIRGRSASGGGPAPAGRGGGPPGGRRRRGKRKKKQTAPTEEIQRNVQKTLAEMGRGRVKRTYDRGGGQEEQEETPQEIQTIRVTEFVSVSELADLMDVKATEVIAICLALGLMVSLNQRIDMETIQVIADEFGFEVEQMTETEVEEVEEEEERPEDLKPRPPVVTVMGHVDHGKTSLLDFVRETNVIDGESGGITQHIGAYEVQTKAGSVTFLDTPGHEAFTAMRARGAQVTDVVVLVIAADDSVMPQTIEAINHARAGQVPIVVAINKIDLPASDPDKIKQQLTEHNVIVEEYGGQTQAVPISAKTGQGVDELLEILALETDLLDLKANPDRMARGVVVEARLDKGRGPVATVLVHAGTLKVGDPFLVGLHSGRVRAMLDGRGNRITEAGPSRPVQVLGLGEVPTAGDTFVVYEEEREARDIAQQRQQLRREQEFNRTKKISLASLGEGIADGEIKTLPVIVKGDVDGSVEALSDELGKLSTAEVAVEVIHRGVGAISESDILLASASNAIIIGFHVRPDARARELAEHESVDIHLYQVIYEAIEELKASLSGMLAARVTEEIGAEVEVRELFKVPRAGTVAGCMVRSGTVTRGSRLRVIRDGQPIYDGRIATLKRHKDDAREVASGFECGILIENFNDVKVGDVLETYSLTEEARTFEESAAAS